MMAVMRERREERQDLTRVVGRGSSWQVVGLDLRMRTESSETVGRRKLEKRDGKWGEVQVGREGGNWDVGADEWCGFSD